MRMIVAELPDGKIECPLGEKTWMCLADRVAFEKRFDTAAAVMSTYRHLVDDDGAVKEGADISAVREEYLLFFAWRELSRGAEGVPGYDEFVDQVLDLDIGVDPDDPDDGEAEEPDPTEGS